MVTQSAAFTYHPLRGILRMWKQFQFKEKRPEKKTRVPLLLIADFREFLDYVGTSRIRKKKTRKKNNLQKPTTLVFLDNFLSNSKHGWEKNASILHPLKIGIKRHWRPTKRTEMIVSINNIKEGIFAVALQNIWLLGVPRQKRSRLCLLNLILEVPS